jgi:thiamine pyrophosphokinase
VGYVGYLKNFYFCEYPKRGLVQVLEHEERTRKMDKAKREALKASRKNMTDAEILSLCENHFSDLVFYCGLEGKEREDFIAECQAQLDEIRAELS